MYFVFRQIEQNDWTFAWTPRKNLSSTCVLVQKSRSGVENSKKNNALRRKNSARLGETFVLRDQTNYLCLNSKRNSSGNEIAFLGLCDNGMGCRKSFGVSFILVHALCLLDIIIVIGKKKDDFFQKEIASWCRDIRLQLFFLDSLCWVQCLVGQFIRYLNAINETW